jgi:hypothetical protein
MTAMTILGFEDGVLSFEFVSEGSSLCLRNTSASTKARAFSTRPKRKTQNAKRKTQN